MQTGVTESRSWRKPVFRVLVRGGCVAACCCLSLSGCTGPDGARAPSNVDEQAHSGDSAQVATEPPAPIEVVEKRDVDGVLLERTEGYYDENDELVRHGVYTRYHSNGKKKLELHYRNGVLHGERTSWYDNGQKSGHGYFKDGREDGVWTTWWPNGFKHQEIHFDEGAWHGPYITWHRNGEMRSRVQYVNGRKQGELVWWDDRGNEVRRQQYVNDVAQP